MALSFFFLCCSSAASFLLFSCSSLLNLGYGSLLPGFKAAVVEVLLYEAFYITFRISGLRSVF